MTDEYSKLPYIGRKRANKLRDAGIGIEEIATMSYEDLKKHLRRLSNGKIRAIIATAREIMGRINDISISLSLEKEKAKILALNDYDLEKIARAKKEDIATLLDIGENDALDIIFKAALRTGVRRREIKINEYINKTGIVSKEGFINGFSSFRIVKKEGIRVFPLIIIVIVVLSAILASIIYISPSIKIDGNFNDWKGVGGYAMGQIGYKFNYYEGVLYFYIQKPDLFHGNESIYLAIDDEDGGYYIHGIYANLVVELYGWNGKVQGAHVWRYISSRYLWNFTTAGGLIYSFRNSQIEGRLNNIKESAKLILIDKSDDYYVSAPVLLSKKTILVVQKGITDIVENNTPIYSIKTIASEKFKLESVDILVSGADIISGNITMGGLSYSGEVFSGGMQFTINREISSEEITFSGNFSGAAGSVVSITSLLHAKGVHFSYQNETSKFYLFSSPQNIAIDGAFGDWKNKKGDIIGDVNDANIDLTNYSYTPDFSKVFMEVRGEIMGGDDVPLLHEWTPKDSDRDGVPDSEDIYPYDFNNDGIPDDETNHDVDGDGFKDYPYGNDTWLNTTIPYDFPSPYAGRHVSVYIGPAPPQKPKSGNDTAEIYLGDGDSSGAHLYWVPFIVDYRITITGRDGIYQSSLYKFSGGAWMFMGTINDIASGYHRMELSTGINMNNGKIWITIFNWNSEEDMPSLSTRRRATTTNVFYLHGIYDSHSFQNMNWNVGSNEQTVDMDNLGSNISWWYENEISENYYIQSATAYLYIQNITDGWWYPKKYINAYLYAVHVSGGSVDKHSLLLYSGWVLLDQPNDGNVYMYTIPLDNVYNTTVYKGWYLTLYVIYWEDYNDTGDYITLYYNSTSYDSRVEVTTNTTMKIVDVWTENDTAMTDTFKAGERVHIFANVTDPLGWQHIDYAHLTVYPSHSGGILSVPMNRLTNGFGYSIFNYSYVLPWNSYVGRYNITIDAYDVEGFSDTNSTYFTLPGDLRLRPRWEKLFVPPSPFSAWFKHSLRNRGNGRDIFNFNVSSSNNFEITIYNDTNGNKIIDSSDVLLAIYDGGWTYIRYDNDSNGDPDIEVNMGARDDIIIQDNVSLSSSNPGEEIDVRVYSTLGNQGNIAKDIASLRAVKTKTLYLRLDPNNNMVLYPSEGNVDEVYNGADYNGRGIWIQNISFANDFTIVGDITVHIWVDKKGANTGTVEIHMDDTTLIGSTSFSMTANGVTEYVATITPQISTIPAGHRIYLVFYGDKKCDVYYNSPNYPSRIDFNTTSYIHVDWTKLYNQSTMIQQSDYSAGDIIAIRAQVRDPFGGYDISSVVANITDPNGTVTTFSMGKEYDNGTYQVYRVDYTIPTNALVGKYNVNVSARESNGVIDWNITSFKVLCNISISPHTNSFSGLIIWYNHTLWNNGSGYDLININISSDTNVNITLYHKVAGGLELMAYSDTGTGWNWINSSWDNDGDGNPDTGFLPSHSTFDIVVRVNASSLPPNSVVNTVVSIQDIYICSDSATDTTTAVPEFEFILPFIVVFMPMLFRRRK